MKKVLLAFADTSPEQYIARQGKKHNYEVVGYCSYREEIIGKIQTLNPDILILREELAGDISIDELALEIRTNYEFCRIIVLLTEYHLENMELVQSLINRGVYDIHIANNLFISQIVDMINTPKKYKDVSGWQSQNVVKKNNTPIAENEINVLVEVSDKAVPINNEQIGVGVQGAYSFVGNTEETLYENPQQTATVNNEGTVPTFAEQGYQETQQYQEYYSYGGGDTEETPTSVLTSQTEQVAQTEDNNTYNYYPSFIFELVNDETTQDFSLTTYGTREINTATPQTTDNASSYSSQTQQNTRNTQMQPTIFYAERRKGNAKVLSFVGVRSGVGCTSSCLNVAKTLANEGKRVLVIDSVYNYGFSDIFTHLGLNKISSFESVLRDFQNGRRGTFKMHCITNNTILNYYGNDPSQKALLDSTANIDYISFSSCFEDDRDLANLIVPVLEGIDGVYDYILVDISLNCHSLYVSELLRTSNKIFLCVNHNLTSMFNAKVTLDEYKFIRGNMSVIVNNYSSGIYDSDNIARYFNVNTCFTVPCENADYIKASVNKLIPVSCSKKVRKVYKKIIRDII